MNSTPLIVLCSIGRLEILQKMYAEITIPAAVYREVTEKEDIFINEIRPIISELKANGFYVSQQVEELVLKYAGEM